MLQQQGKPLWTAALDAEFQGCRAFAGPALINRVRQLVGKLPPPNREVLLSYP